MFITLVSFFLILIVLILVHELGHFSPLNFSKSGGRVWHFHTAAHVFIQKGETVYSLKLDTSRGFTKLAGEEDPAVPGSLASKSIPVRLAVLGAGH